MNNPKHKKSHLNWSHLQKSHIQVARFHTCRAWKKLCKQPLCAQRMPPNRRLAHGAWLSMLRRWIVDVSPPDVHGLGVAMYIMFENHLRS